VTDTNVIEIAVQTLMVTAKVAAPILLVSLAVGFGISLLQSATQIQDVTLTFVPKIIGVAIVIVVGGNWMLAELVGFTHRLFDMVPSLLG
jgi:flagellar biosynthetic protein FliQ